MSRPLRRFLVVAAACAIAVLSAYCGVLGRVLEQLHLPLRVSPSAILPVCLPYSALLLAVTACVVWWKEQRAVISFILIALCFTCCIGEVGVRVLHRKHALLDEEYWYSPLFDHVLPPNRTLAVWDRKGHVAGATRTPLLHVNSDGLRTTYTRDSFSAHKMRIAFLGDSFTMGYGVDQKASFVEGVEARLRSDFPDADVAVLNAGVTSYSPIIEALQYEAIVRAYRPQLVILVLDETDFGDDAAYEAISEEVDGRRMFLNSGYWRGATSGWSDHVALMQRLPGNARAMLARPVRSLFNVNQRADDTPLVDLHGGKVRSRFFIYKFPRSVTSKYYERTLANIERVDREVVKDGARFGLVIAPRYPHFNPAESPDNWEADEYKDRPFLGDYLDFFAEAKARETFDIFSLLPALSKSKVFPLCFTDDPHWNENGHAVVADVVTQHIRETWGALLTAKLMTP